MIGHVHFFGDKRSGNCLKGLWTAEHLQIPYRWTDVDVFSGETRTKEFLALNPAGQVPVMQLHDGRTLAQSNAIMLYLAEGSALIPEESFERAKMFEWLFWEQYSHEPVIAVRRARKRFLRLSDEEIDPALLPRGEALLGVMEGALARSGYFAGGRLSLADLALVAYTRWAHQGGWSLGAFPRVQDWIRRVEAALRLAPGAEEA